MSSLSLDAANVTENEPRMHPAAGFLAPPSVGMRLAPEILILELFRDVFYANERNLRTQTCQLAPDIRTPGKELVYSKEDRAIISAFRGRRKKHRKAEETFYAPAYPALAAHAWLAKKRERVVSVLLFKGAIAQHLWGTRTLGPESKGRQRDFVELVAGASAGTRRKKKEDGQEYDDILAACLPPTSRYCDTTTAVETLEDLTADGSNTIFRTAANDELASRIFHDFEVLGEVEAELPRLLWLRLLMTYLRFALPMWLLAQMRITVLTHGWMVRALEGGEVPDDIKIAEALGSRNRCLIRPTLIPTGEVLGRIREYVRCRVELNVMLYAVAKLRPSEFSEKFTIVTTDSGSNRIKLSELFLVARRASGELQAEPKCLEAGSVATFVARYSEQFAAWRDPLLNGQGKNIDEFLRVLYRDDRGDEAGGHLLVKHGRGDTMGFRVFPGQMLLQLMTMLAAKTKHNSQGGGRLVLKDIEDHFEEYGINFSSAAEARPFLMAELQSLGLLAGSPDAGSSVAVTSPF